MHPPASDQQDAQHKAEGCHGAQRIASKIARPPYSFAAAVGSSAGGRLHVYLHRHACRRGAWAASRVVSVGPGACHLHSQVLQSSICAIYDVVETSQLCVQPCETPSESEACNPVRDRADKEQEPDRPNVGDNVSPSIPYTLSVSLYKQRAHTSRIHNRDDSQATPLLAISELQH
jgi:hypothetical protein